jgi:hypothetical protein
MLAARGMSAAGKAVLLLAGSLTAATIAPLSAAGAEHVKDCCLKLGWTVVCMLDAAVKLQQLLPSVQLPGTAAARCGIEQQLMQELQELQRLLLPASTAMHAAVGVAMPELLATGSAAAADAAAHVPAASAVAVPALAGASAVVASSLDRSDGSDVCCDDTSLEFCATLSTSSSGHSVQPSEALSITAEALPHVGPKLIACGKALAALCPVALCCNNPGCVELRGASELQLVAGKGSVCSRCR